MTLDPRRAWLRQLAAFAVLSAIWEAVGRAGLLNPLYAPTPSLIGAALVDLFSDGRIWPHLEATFAAALGGFVPANKGRALQTHRGARCRPPANSDETRSGAG